MKLELIANWKKAYAMYSMWAFALLGLTPQLFDLAVQFNLLDSETTPAVLAKLINIVAFVGAASRIVQQKTVELSTAQPASTS